MAEEITGILEQMLLARELRWKRRLELQQSYPALVSMTLCLPIEFRTAPEWKALLLSAADETEDSLLSAGFSVLLREETDSADGMAVFIAVDSGNGLKKKCILLEENLKAGRFLDIDVSCTVPVSRRDLGLPPRKCFVCGEPAADCVALRRHSRGEISDYVKSCESFLIPRL